MGSAPLVAWWHQGCSASSLCYPPGAGSHAHAAAGAERDLQPHPAQRPWWFLSLCSGDKSNSHGICPAHRALLDEWSPPGYKSNISDPQEICLPPQELAADRTGFPNIVCLGTSNGNGQLLAVWPLKAGHLDLALLPVAAGSPVHPDMVSVFLGIHVPSTKPE